MYIVAGVSIIVVAEGAASQLLVASVPANLASTQAAMSVLAEAKPIS
jgi:hypothetical protein